MDTGMEGQITAEMDTCWWVAASVMDGWMCGYKTQVTRMDTWTNGWRVAGAGPEGRTGVGMGGYLLADEWFPRWVGAASRLV